MSCVFEMVFYPAFNVSKFMWSLPVFAFFISGRAASISHAVIADTTLGVSIDYGIFLTVVLFRV